MIKLQWDENALEFLHDDIPGSEDLSPVFMIYNGEYYWIKMLALFSSSTKKFYWISGSGCSCCRSLTDGLKSPSDLTEGTAIDLKRAVRAFTEEEPSLLKDDEMQKIFSKIKKQK